MGVVIGLGVGVGLVLVWLGLTSPQPERPAEERTGRTRDLLDRAGLAGTSAAGVR